MAATLLDLTQQGDVATISDESKLDRVQLLSPQQLYELWERQQWLSQEIDFSQDKDDWASSPMKSGSGSCGGCRRSSWARSVSRPSSRGS